MQTETCQTNCTTKFSINIEENLFIDLESNSKKEETNFYAISKSQKNVTTTILNKSNDKLDHEFDNGRENNNNAGGGADSDEVGFGYYFSGSGWVQVTIFGSLGYPRVLLL